MWEKPLSKAFYISFILIIIFSTSYTILLVTRIILVPSRYSIRTTYGILSTCRGHYSGTKIVKYATLTLPLVQAFSNSIPKNLNHPSMKRRHNLFIDRTYPFTGVIDQSISTFTLTVVGAMNDDDDIDVTNLIPNSTIDACSDIVCQPLYITIGPPCAGKTTWIQKRNRILSNKILDICIDEQPGVYKTIPIQYFLPRNSKYNHNTKGINNDTSNNDNNNNTIRQSLSLSDTVFGRTIYERIQDQNELRTIIHRFANIITRDEFYASITSSILFNVVEDIIHEYKNENIPIQLPSTIDLFVLEAIFRRTPSNTVSSSGMFSAIERTEQLLYNTSTSIPIAWGNTNTKPTDYAEALRLASQSHRPVYFVVYNDDKDDDDTKHEFDLFDLSVEHGLHGLTRRNIYRFLQTGRYIPINVIIDMRDCTNQMINNVLSLNQTYQVKITKFEFHKRLAQIAGFYMNDDRTVTLTIENQSKQNNVGMKSSRNVYRQDEIVNTSTNQHHVHNQSTSTMKRRPWDRPASAVRGYNGRMDIPNTKHIKETR
jgi:hypothetical protein